jgi:thioredoxin reductase
MGDSYDIVIVGGGPGGITAGVKADEAGLSYLVLEKGPQPFQGIIDTYPKGKKVYPTIPKGAGDPFPVEGLTPPKDKIPVEAYINQVIRFVDSVEQNIRCNALFQEIDRRGDHYTVKTNTGVVTGRYVIFAFGSNIPNELGVYGEAKTVAYRLENPEAYTGIATLVIGGGNAAADIVAALSRVKREAGDPSPVYWGHVREKFKVSKNTARDLGEEILLGGQIKILQGAIPKIGEVDSEGIDRLYIHQKPEMAGRDDVFIYQGMSFPMKNVIACIGTHGPAEIFNKVNLQQITCTGTICKISKEGEQLLLLTEHLETGRKGIYAIGGAISPSYMEIQAEGMIKERKHANLIYTAMQDAVRAIGGIQLSESNA